MTNKRKDKKLYNLWLTKKEEENLIEKLEKENRYLGDLEIIGLIIESANKRGDFYKK